MGSGRTGPQAGVAMTLLAHGHDPAQVAGQGWAALLMETCSRNHALPLPELGLAKGSTWVADTDLRLSSAHIEHSSLAIPARTRLRAEQSVSAANVWFRTVLFRLFVLDGPQAGECVWVETDERADLARHSLRRVKTADEIGTWDRARLASTGSAANAAPPWLTCMPLPTATTTPTTRAAA